MTNKTDPSGRVRSRLPDVRAFTATLDAGNAEIKQASAGLNDRLRSFEEWIAKVPGRVGAEAWIDDPEGPAESKFGLQLARAGKTWRLEYCYFHEEFGDPSELGWAPLLDATMNAKLAAVDALPSLLDKMQEAQGALVTRIQEANAKFDTLAKSVGLNAQAGG